MKFRKGFVTNSSSSSFIVAVKDDGSETLNAFMKAFVDSEDYNETRKGHSYKTKEELDKYYVENFKSSRCKTLEKILEDDEYLEEQYNKELECIEKGFVILTKDIGYGDDGLTSFVSIFAESLGENAILFDTD